MYRLILISLLILAGGGAWATGSHSAAQADEGPIEIAGTVYVDRAPLDSSFASGGIAAKRGVVRVESGYESYESSGAPVKRGAVHLGRHAPLDLP